MDKDEAYEIGLAALKAFVKKKGKEERFPVDAIWGYADEKIPSLQKPGVANRLKKEGFIVPTGGVVRAVTGPRAGAPSTEYALGPRMATRNGGSAPKPSSAARQTSPKPQSVAAALKELHAALNASGYIFSLAELANFYLASLSSPILIMAGITGTGKSSLPRMFADLIGGTFISIPVKPQWDDNSDLFGYTSPLHGNQFQPGPFTRAMLTARANPAEPFLILLDEMNLAHVEHYFSDFLSVIPTRKRDGGAVVTDCLPLDLPLASPGAEDQYSEYRGLYLPSNVVVYGTANLDETTKSFSPKVLDRAFSIEFEDVDLTLFGSHNGVGSPSERFSVIKNRLVDPSNPIDVEEVRARAPQLCDEVGEYFEELRAILGPSGIRFGYRPRNAACVYMWHWQFDGLAEILPKNAALDYCILQKILPKIYGQGDRLKTALEAVLQWFEGQGVQGTDDDPDRQFVRSAAKLNRMIQRLEDEGSTSYWGA